MSKKNDVYRDYVRGEASESDVHEVFGGDFDEFVERRKWVDLMRETPNKPPSDGLLD